jgi:hypothetical protein
MIPKTDKTRPRIGDSIRGEFRCPKCHQDTVQMFYARLETGYRWLCRACMYPSSLPINQLFLEKDFNQALVEFTNAAYTLLDAWERLDHTGDYFATEYPFDKCFSDVVTDIINWRDYQIKKTGEDKND